MNNVLYQYKIISALQRDIQYTLKTDLWIHSPYCMIVVIHFKSDLNVASKQAIGKLLYLKKNCLSILIKHIFHFVKSTLLISHTEPILY